MKHLIINNCARNDVIEILTAEDLIKICSSLDLQDAKDILWEISKPTIILIDELNP